MLTNFKAVMTVIVVLLVVAAPAGAMRWWMARQLHQERIETLRQKALADSLREVVGGWEIRALLAEKDSETLADVNADLRKTIEDSGRTVLAATSALARFESSNRIATTAAGGASSTRIAWENEDPRLHIGVDLEFPGVVSPNPNPPVTGTADVAAIVRPDVVLSCGDDGGPVVNVGFDDERVTVFDLVSRVPESMACLPPPPTFWETFIPDITPGNALLGGAAFTAGVLFGGR